MASLASIIESTQKSLYIFGAAGRSSFVEAGLLNLGRELEKIECKIFVESDANLFTKSLISDTEIADERVSFSKLMFDQRRLVDNLPRKFSKLDVEVKICYLDLPTNFVISDGKIFVSDWIITPINNYSEIKSSTQRGKSLRQFAEYILSEDEGGKYCAPYRNKKGEVTETIELFDEDRVRRGIFPRSSFYDTDFIKLVVWVFIFDRKGRLLIHKRDENAKDNQGMWDKSVGGHADYLVDVDTSKTVPREVIEELLTNEKVGNKFVRTNDDDVIFLGDWRPSKRDDRPFHEIREYDSNWVYFKLPDGFRTTSPRILPDGSQRRNEVIADVYMFILSDEITDDTLVDLENSDYKFILPTDLKTSIDRARFDGGDPNFEEKSPKFSPDLTVAFTSKLRDRLEEFQAFVASNLG